MYIIFNCLLKKWLDFNYDFQFWLNNIKPLNKQVKGECSVHSMFIKFYLQNAIKFYHELLIMAKGLHVVARQYAI